MDRYTDLELILGGLLLATAIGLIILWIRNNALRSLVLLKPGKDKLRVRYYWLEHKLIGRDNETLRETEETYVYVVEGTRVLVSKEASRKITLSTPALIEEDAKVPSNDVLRNEASKTAGSRHPKDLKTSFSTSALNAESNEEPSDDTEEDELSLTGGIRPPTNFRKPPGVVGLMAIEISVEEGDEDEDI